MPLKEIQSLVSEEAKRTNLRFASFLVGSLSRAIDKACRRAGFTPKELGGSLAVAGGAPRRGRPAGVRVRLRRRRMSETIKAKVIGMLKAKVKPAEIARQVHYPVASIYYVRNGLPD